MNDWPVIMEGLVFSHQSTWPRAYFVLYLIVVVAVVLNVVCVCNPEGGFPPQYYCLKKYPPCLTDPPTTTTLPTPPPRHPFSLAFMIQTFGVEKEKHKELHKMALTRGTQGEGAVVDALDKSFTGLVDWRQILRESGVDFSGYLFARTRHYTDAFDKLYKEDILGRFPNLFQNKA